MIRVKTMKEIAITMVEDGTSPVAVTRADLVEAWSLLENLVCSLDRIGSRHGGIRELQTKPLEAEDTTALMKSITPERIQQEFEETGSGDFGFAYGDAARFRVSIFKQKGVASLVLRRIPNTILTFEQIGLPKMAEQICRRPRAIFLVTGPTGSGKTTTLATMIDHINTNFERHIITMEDPIEYYHQHKKSVVVQREVGVDVPNFSEALRRALRQDPDVRLVC